MDFVGSLLVLEITHGSIVPTVQDEAPDRNRVQSVAAVVVETFPVKLITAGSGHCGDDSSVRSTVLRSDPGSGDVYFLKKFKRCILPRTAIDLTIDADAVNIEFSLPS